MRGYFMKETRSALCCHTTDNPNLAVGWGHRTLRLRKKSTFKASVSVRMGDYGMR